MRNDAGYSLMEVLVMLAITALLAATVLESVRAAASNALRIERAAREASQPFVSMAAARLAVEGTRADHRGSETAFSGDRRGFNALTAAPVVADTTALEAYRMIVEQDGSDTVLVYEDRAGRFEVRRWRDAQATFRYLGEPARSIADLRLAMGEARQRVWSESWPPDTPAASAGFTTHYVAPPLAIEVVIQRPDRADERVVFPLPVNGGPPLRPDDVF